MPLLVASIVCHSAFTRRIGARSRFGHIGGCKSKPCRVRRCSPVTITIIVIIVRSGLFTVLIGLSVLGTAAQGGGIRRRHKTLAPRV